MSSFNKPSDEITQSESLARCLFSPYHVDKTGRLKFEAFKPPFDLDELSVNRIDFAGEDFCHFLGQKAARPNALPPKMYRGLAVILYQKVVAAGAFARSSPIERPEPNLFHADIFYGSVLTKADKTMPPLFKAVLQSLADASSLKSFIGSDLEKP